MVTEVEDELSSGGDADERIQEPVHVTLPANQSTMYMGHQLGAGGGRVADSFVLPDPTLAADANMQQRLALEHHLYLSFRIADFGDALGMALRHHLSRHFAHVTVEIGDAPPAGGLFVVPTLHTSFRMKKSADLTLVSTGRYQVQASGHGTRRSGAHMLWAVPLSLLAPLGTLLSIIGSANVANGHARHAMAEAVDRAAAAWAAELARTWRPPGQQPTSR